MTAADAEAFIDGVVQLQLAREDIAGAVVLVIKDGKILFSKGYGYSDVAKKTPVYPDRTLFRPASISKLFTWTAIMQLVEQGKLDLDHDVNEYLDFKIPPTYSQSITLRNLMTHTPGFEESLRNSSLNRASDLKPLGDYLKRELPGRVYPPGKVPAYSNYGAALAGYIVQRVSGQPFEDYIEEHIFKPLSMTNSTFREPLPESLNALMSKGYELASEPPKPFELINDVPAGASSIAATDMAHFMVAHLNNGQFNGAQILRRETAVLMHSRQFGSFPDMNAMALGFYEESRNGHRIIGHAGDLNYFHSDLHLILDAGVGFFVSYNSAGKGEIDPRDAVWHQFLDRYFPYEPPAGLEIANAAKDAETVSGRYIASRRSQTTLAKLGWLFLEDTNVFANSDGTVSVTDLKDLNGRPKHFREIGPLIFRNVNDQDRLAFKRDDAGRFILVTDDPTVVFQRPPLSENGTLDVPIIITTLTIFVLNLLQWPIAAIIRRHYGKTLNLTWQQRRLRIVVRTACALYLIFSSAFVAVFWLATKNDALLSSRLDPWLRLIQVVGWLGVVLLPAVLYNSVSSWANRERWWWSKLSDTVITLASLAFIWFVFTWKMLAFTLKY